MGVKEVLEAEKEKPSEINTESVDEHRDSQEYHNEGFVYKNEEALQESYIDRPSVNIGPVLTLDISTYDTLANAFVNNSLPSIDEFNQLSLETGLNTEDIQWFYLK